MADVDDAADCQLCVFISHESNRTWEGGHLLGLQFAVRELDPVASGHGVGLSKLEIFRRLVVRSDPEGTLIENSPDYLLCLLIMDSVELGKWCCHDCGEGLVYVSTTNARD